VPYLRKNNKPQSFAAECFVDEKVLLKVVGRVLESEMFLELSKLNRKDELAVYLNDVKIQLTSRISGDDCIDIVAAIDKNIFNNMLEMLVKCDAEVVVFYFSNYAIHFDQFLLNRTACFNPQKRAIENGCLLVCTWVTNEDKLHFYYDSSKYSSELISRMLQ